MDSRRLEGRPDALPVPAGGCRFRSIIEHTPDAVALLSTEGTILYANHAASAALGYEPKSVIGEDAFTDIHPDDLEATRERFRRLLEYPGGSTACQYRCMHRLGCWMWIEVVATNLLHEPNVRAVVLNYRDITEKRRVEQALLESEARYRLLAEHATDMIARLSPDGVYLYASPACRQLLGYEPRELIGAPSHAMLHPEDLARIGQASPGIKAMPETVVFTYRIRHKDGGYVWFETTSRTVRDPESGVVREFVTVSRDITERKRLEEELTRQAFYDPVTWLPNRTYFMDRLSESLACPDRAGSPVAVMFLDLDRFKLVNDVFGHAAGDELLREVSQRLRRSLRGRDTVARFGGDEFTILPDSPSGLPEVEEIARRLIQRFQAPFVLAGRETFISLSVGIALSAGGTDHPEDLLRNADVALYHAKTSGKAHYVVFDRPMRAAVTDRLHLEADLRLALERGELRLHYQPEVDLATGGIIGVEALLRWEHPRRGLLLPADFLPVAEETGLIKPLGRWVREEACRQARAWNGLRADRPPLLLSVNLSAWEFQHPQLVSEVLDSLRESGLPSPSFRLELSEAVLVENLEAAVQILGALRESGLRIAIDDFGAGYSSLASLQRLPVDVLKIDRSFVQELSRDRKSRSILQAITQLARALEIDVTAEGIESLEQRRELLHAHCTRGQGFLYSRPVSAEAMGLLLRA